ncbi:barstar family protein [Nonomuraea sp. NPDC050310]|uniref:barstar family protein n=1 Tax=unclassified Nonomuraea TaxID=2593643 RepID=UPI0033F35DF1
MSTKHLITGDSTAEVIAAIARQLSFPDYFGGTLDSLYDCLTDLEWLPDGDYVLVWNAPGRLAQLDPEGYSKLASALTDAVATGTFGGPRLSIVFRP